MEHPNTHIHFIIIYISSKSSSQVFQDQISEDAKNLRSGKNLHAKKSLDRLNAVQKDVQQSVSEVSNLSKHGQHFFKKSLQKIVQEKTYLAQD